MGSESVLGGSGGSRGIARGIWKGSVGSGRILRVLGGILGALGGFWALCGAQVSPKWIQSWSKSGPKLAPKAQKSTICTPTGFQGALDKFLSPILEAQTSKNGFPRLQNGPQMGPKWGKN